MIGWLSGTVRHLFPDRVILETGGVGYEVYLPASLALMLGPVGSQTELFIHTHVREDGILLFGFSSLAERQLFSQLNNVGGIGAKTAMAILSAMPAERLVQAIQSGDSQLLKQTPGIGKKTAERMIMELRDRLRDFAPVSGGTMTSTGSPAADLVSALVNLGYKRFQAETAVASVELSKFTSFDTMLKETLKVLSK